MYRNALMITITDYQDNHSASFYYNAFLMLSNGTESKRIGTLGSKI